jgi:cytoskeletal protein RodZ
MKNQAPKRLDLRSVYGVMVIILIVLGVLWWSAAMPLLD